MTAHPWLEYRLDSLTFKNGVRLKFPPSTRLLYEPDDHVIAIELTAKQRGDIKQNIPVVAGSSPDFELRRIEYSMLVDLPSGKKTLRFFHPMKPGTGVRLTINDRGELFFMQQDGKPLFSKDYTLRDVSRGQIDSDRAVWQFHGYRHEH